MFQDLRSPVYIERRYGDDRLPKLKYFCPRACPDQECRLAGRCEETWKSRKSDVAAALDELPLSLQRDPGGAFSCDYPSLS